MRQYVVIEKTLTNMSLEIPIYVVHISIAVLALLFVILLVLFIRQNIRLKRILKGKGAKTLEDSINTLEKKINEHEKFRQESILYFQNIEKRIQSSVRGVETIRFNPFRGTGSGGNQSFATAILDENGDGAVISSLYSRDRTSVFSKPLKKFKSEFELSEEEKEAIQKAKQKTAFKK